MHSSDGRGRGRERRRVWSRGPWSRGILLGALLTALMGLSACADPCEELANRLCNRRGTDGAQCGRWHERTGRVPDETCAAGLRLLDRERVR